MIISLTGPSGAGKEFLKKALLQQFPLLKELCWTTTRLLRPGEIQGATRESVSKDEFEKLTQSGELRFVQKVFNNSYGIRWQLFQNKTEWLLIEFHIDNLIQASQNGLHPIAIGLVPFHTTFLKERLLRRGTESTREMLRRLELAKTEINKMYQHRTLFSFLVQFTKKNEHTVVERVCEFLKPQIEPKG